MVAETLVNGNSLCSTPWQATMTLVITLALESTQYLWPMTMLFKSLNVNTVVWSYLNVPEIRNDGK